IMDNAADQSDEQTPAEQTDREAAAVTTETAGADPEASRQVNPRMRLYTLRVASNKEDRVKDALARKRKIEGLEHKIDRILVPTKRVRSVQKGQRKDSELKLYPGYVFIEIEPDEHGRIPQDVWFMVKETEGVGDFSQASGKPHPMGKDEAERMIGEAEKKDEPEMKTDYEKGDRIKVVVGAFEGFDGEVEEVLPDKGQVRIITTIFGRPTPLELGYDEIEKV